MKRIIALLVLSCFLSTPVFAASTVFKTSTGYGLKDGNGKILLKPVYQGISQLSYTPSKKFIVPMHAMDEVEVKVMEVYKVKKNNLWGTVNSSGKITNPCKYKNVEVTDNGEIKLHTDDEIKYANPVKNIAKNTRDTMVTVIALPVSLVGIMMMPIEAVSKMGRKE